MENWTKFDTRFFVQMFSHNCGLSTNSTGLLTKETGLFTNGTISDFFCVCDIPTKMWKKKYLNLFCGSALNKTKKNFMTFKYYEVTYSEICLGEKPENFGGELYSDVALSVSIFFWPPSVIYFATPP